MAHYALLDENNVVVQVITGRNENEVVQNISDWEAHYSEVTGLVAKRTSYNTYRKYDVVFDPVAHEVVSRTYVGSAHLLGGTPFRGQYATIGDVYDPELDEFVTPQTGAK